MVETITMPENAVESTASYFWMSDGIVMILNKPKSLHSLEDAIENIEFTRNISAGIPRPLLIDITHIKSINREARELYANEGSIGRVKAVALVTQSAMSRIVGNFFLSFNKPEAPTKLFSNHASAKNWLRGFI